MISLFIFYIHVIGFTAAFTNEFQKEGLTAGFLTVGFMALIFSVGWSISTFFLKYVMDQEGFSIWLNRDSISLILLTTGEAFFYNFYFNADKKKTTAA